MLSSSTKMLRRGFTTSVTSVLRKQLSEPISPHDLHRAGGISSFMRLPIAQPPKAKGDLDVAFLGIPFDTATSNRPGARFENSALFSINFMSAHPFAQFSAQAQMHLRTLVFQRIHLLTLVPGPSANTFAHFSTRPKCKCICAL
jgi:hypothetical protein